MTWENDLSLFLEDDEDDGDSTGPRSAAFDLINVCFLIIVHSPTNSTVLISR